ncbi:MAG: hypothetical protein R3C60_11515 [Parvularculaceae bacterium]
MDEKTANRFDALERAAFETPSGMGSAAVKAFSAAPARTLRASLRRKLKKAASGQANSGAVRRAIKSRLDFCDRYFRRIEQAAELGFYERLFAAWHVLHLPLFILLIITAIIHVVAVHLY